MMETRMRTTLRRVHREQSGLVGKIIVVWLVFVAVIGIFAIDAASVLFTKFRLSDAAATAASTAVSTYESERDVTAACNAAELSVRQSDPDLEVLVHPECRADVARLANAVLSTSGMVKYAKERPALRFLVVTECGLSDRLAMEVPNKTFLKGCKLCTFMKVTTLEDVRDSLQKMQYEIDVPEEIRVPAERALRRMFEATEGKER